MQHLVAEGASAETVQQRALIKTPAVAARYLSRGRHHAKLAKLAMKVRHQSGSGQQQGRSRARTQAMLRQQGLISDSSSEEDI